MVSSIPDVVLYINSVNGEKRGTRLKERVFVRLPVYLVRTVRDVSKAPAQSGRACPFCADPIDLKAIGPVRSDLALSRKSSKRVQCEEPNNPTTNSLVSWLTARRHGLAGNGQYWGNPALSSLPGLPVGLPTFPTWDYAPVSTCIHTRPCAGWPTMDGVKPPPLA